MKRDNFLLHGVLVVRMPFFAPLPRWSDLMARDREDRTLRGLDEGAVAARGFAAASDAAVKTTPISDFFRQTTRQLRVRLAERNRVNSVGRVATLGVTMRAPPF